MKEGKCNCRQKDEFEPSAILLQKRPQTQRKRSSRAQKMETIQGDSQNVERDTAVYLKEKRTIRTLQINRKERGDLEARYEFWAVSGMFFTVITFTHSVKLFLPKESPFPVKHIARKSD